MSLDVSLLALVIIGVVSFVFIRFGATALTMTGLSRDVAEFQAVSAFFGVGFTTSEAELVVSHPVRRRICRHLIIAGNIGLTGAVAAVIVAVVRSDETIGGPLASLIKFGIIGTIVLGLLLAARFSPLVRLVDHVISKSIKNAGVVRPMDYETVLRAGSGYCISEVDIEPPSAYAGRTLASSRLADHGVLILGVTRSDGLYIGAPDKDTVIDHGDMLIVYGHEDAIDLAFGHRRESAEA